MHESFSRAIRPESRFRVLGLRLKPLTLGHLLLLHEIGSPLIQGKPHGVGDLLAAVFVCSHADAEQARRNLHRFWLVNLYGFVWAIRCRYTDIQENWKRFFDYLNAERERPPTRTPEASVRQEISAPWEWVLLDFLCTVCGWSEDQALRTPMLKANALWTVHQDSNGRLSLATAQDSVEATIKGIWDRIRATRNQEEAKQ